MEVKNRNEVGNEVGAEAVDAQSTTTAEADATAGSVDGIATTLQSLQTKLKQLQSKLHQLQAKLHKEFRWYCDTILQGGSLAVRIAYRVQPAADILQAVDDGEVRTDPALGEYCILIGTSLYSEEDMDKLLAVEYLLDDLYDTWCGIEHNKEEWSDTVDRYLDTISKEESTHGVH